EEQVARRIAELREQGIGEAAAGVVEIEPDREGGRPGRALVGSAGVFGRRRPGPGEGARGRPPPAPGPQTLPLSAADLRGAHPPRFVPPRRADRLLRLRAGELRPAVPRPGDGARGARPLAERRGGAAPG